ncbi:MAG: hypothetical protein HY047_05800 [Acidobacteria bacterium]|nr:hypothetical protein [Acidobacteriota bacterium]
MFTGEPSRRIADTLHRFAMGCIEKCFAQRRLVQPDVSLLLRFSHSANQFITVSNYLGLFVESRMLLEAAVAFRFARVGPDDP